MAARSWGSDRPLSLLQERMWLLGRLHPGTDLFTLPVTLEFKGKLHLAPLSGALSATIARQDTLSGQVVEVDGAARHRAGSFPSDLPLLDGTQELPPQMLTGGALATARLVRLERNLHQLQMLIHHMAFDGLSAPLLISDLNAAYHAILDGAPPDQALPPLPNRYADFAAWQHEWVASPAGTATLDRWREALAGAPELSIATDHPRRIPLSFRAGSHPFALGDRIDNALRGFCARHGVTPFMAMAGVFALVMARRSGQASDVLIGVPHSARRDPRWASTVGLFANMVPLRVRLSPRLTFLDLVRAVRAEAVRVVADGGTPFDQIVREIRPARDPSRLPLCPVSFQVIHGPTGELPCAGMYMRQLPSARQFTEFEISMFLTDGQGLPGIIEYATDLFEPATIATISAEFQELCGHLLRRPDQPIAAADQHGSRRAALMAPILLLALPGLLLVALGMARSLPRRVRRVAPLPSPVATVGLAWFIGTFVPFELLSAVLAAGRATCTTW